MRAIYQATAGQGIRLLERRGAARRGRKRASLGPRETRRRGAANDVAARLTMCGAANDVSAMNHSSLIVTFSILSPCLMESTTFWPSSSTRPKTECLPSSQGVATWVMKN